jgi:hypothetical protein
VIYQYVLCKLIPVLGCSMYNIEVNSIQNSISKRARGGPSPKEVIP